MNESSGRPGTSLSRKLFASAVAAIAASSAAWFAWQRLRAEPVTVSIVDTSENVGQLLNRRFRPGAERAGADRGGEYPPPLVLEPLDEETAALFFPAIGKSELWVYDPLAYLRRASHRSFFRRFEEHPDGGWRVNTNALGLREDEEVRSEKPDVRIVVTGDSHTDGLCATHESFANVLEALLAEEWPEKTVESLNAGTGSHNLYNYLGTVERLAGLDPDVFIVVVYGGNDFSGAMILQRFFHHRRPWAVDPHRLAVRDTGETLGSIGPQELKQEVYFLNNPGDEAVAVDLVCSISVELARRCARVGAELLFVYLPPPNAGQPGPFREELDEVRRAADLEGVELGVSDRIADPWLRFLGERGLAHIDLRPHFRAAGEVLYWRTDHHLDVAGHRLVGEVLFEHFAGRTGD